jgi:hypothetical protein
MNTNIERLIEQSTGTLVKQSIFSESINVVDGVFDKEKFAELIIQECLNAIAASTDRPANEEDYLMFHGGLFTAITAIKKHFGVE